MISIDTLPDEALLAIFDFCADEMEFTKHAIEVWQSLVHVCRRWRSIVFGSPRRLNLRLVCTAKTPARGTLDVWPALPLLIRDSAYLTEDVDNIVAVLERRDRVDKIELFDVQRVPLETILAAMQEPFPELTDLMFLSYDEIMPVISNSFLGGSAPRLQSFQFRGIPFPGLPNLLSTAPHLVDLHLDSIPHSGYISPEAMVACLVKLTSLEKLTLRFLSPRSFPDRESRRPPPLTCSILPILTYFGFKGVSEYLDDLVARIAVPQLTSLYITFFNQIVFDTPQLVQFISRTPRLKALERAHIAFEDNAARVNLSLPQTFGYGSLRLNVKISCSELGWQVSSLEQICTSCLPPLSTVEYLCIYMALYPPHWQDAAENTLWLELLHPFTSVKNLYLSEEFAPHIVPALQELIGGRTTEVLPTLQTIFLEGLSSGPVQEGIGKFVAARQLSGHPITVSLWERDSEQDWISEVETESGWDSISEVTEVDD